MDKRAKSLIGITVAVVLILAGAVVFGFFAGESGSGDPEAREQSPAATPSVTAPADPEEAQIMAEINKAIADVTAEAAARPKDDRMTPEEVEERIRQKIDEIRARQ